MASNAYTFEEPTFSDEALMVCLTYFFKIVLLACSLCVSAVLRHHALVSHQLDRASDLEVDHLELPVFKMSPLFIKSYEFEFIVLRTFVDWAANNITQVFTWHKDGTVFLARCI